MDHRHTSSESVRAYLLGTIGEEESSALELEYFADRELFAWIKDVEADLIRDYIARRLEPGERERFERKYLRVPELLARVEEIRAEGKAAHRPQVRWSMIAAGVGILFFAISPWWISRLRAPRPEELAKAEPPVALAIRLSPGLAKGTASQVEFTTPGSGRVRFTLELPGRRSQEDCLVTMEGVDGGIRGLNWSVRSAPSGTGQEVAVETDASALPPADYIARVAQRSGEVLESYSFRVNARHP